MKVVQSLVGWLCLVYGALATARAVQVVLGGEGDGVLFMAVLGGGMTVAGVGLIRASSGAKALPGALEPAILRVARNAGGRVVVLEVVAAVDAPVDQVDRALQAMRDRGLCEELVGESGVSVYRFPGLEDLQGGKRDLLEPAPPADPGQGS